MKHYVCVYIGGEFDFYADSHALALDHARYHCAVSGLRFIAIKGAA